MEFEWVQCDKCQKWRGLKPEVFKRVVQNETWFCFQNPDVTQASCEVPQVLTDSEIDAIYKKREIAKTKKLLHPVIWQEIHSNVYTYKRRKSWKEDDIAICQCRLVGGIGCLENCINRMLNIECTQGYCPCGSSCSNQRFSRRQHAHVEIKRAGLKGFGLFCVDDIREGDFVTEYMGEIVDESEYHRRRNFYAENGHKHYYFMQIGNGEVIDACRMGNVGRFMNHSCEPNCETQKWVVKGDLRVGFFALRTIKAGEELTFNYNFQTEKPIRCCCGSSKCNGTLGRQKTDNVILDDIQFDSKDNDVPDPIMLKEDEVDDVMHVILERQVGLFNDADITTEQIHARLSEEYVKRGLLSLVDNLETKSQTSSIRPQHETSSGESSEQTTTIKEVSTKKKGRGRGRISHTSLLDRRRSGFVRSKFEAEPRRSEVDSSLADITAASGRLYSPSRKNILKVLRLFNLIEIGMNEKERHEAELAREKEEKDREALMRSGQIYLGTTGRSQPRQPPINIAGYCVNEPNMDDGPPTARQRAQFADLSLLLDVVQHTIDPVARSLFIECGVLSQLQQVIGRNFGPQYSVMLRKILKVVDCLPLEKTDFEKTRSAHGTMEDLITALTYHKDNGVRSMALSIARQYNLETEPENNVKEEMHSGRQSVSRQSSNETPSSISGCVNSEVLRSKLTGLGRENDEEISITRIESQHPLSIACNHDVHGSLFPPPPPPPPPMADKPREETPFLGETSGNVSLPPGFGYSKSCRDRTTIVDVQMTARPSNGIYSVPHTLQRSNEVSQPFSEIQRYPIRTLESVKRKDFRQRILRRVKAMENPEGLFSHELGKLNRMSHLARHEILAKEAQELEEERRKRQRMSSQSESSELEGWDHLSRDFEEFVSQTLRQRIQKYKQPEHPLKLSESEADALFVKLYALIIESEENAFRVYSKDRIRRHVSKAKLALNIKEFTSKTMHNYYDYKSHQS